MELAVLAAIAYQTQAPAPGPGPEWLLVTIALISSLGIGGLGASWITARVQKRKLSAEAEHQGASAVKALTESAVAIVNEIQERLVETQQETREAHRELAEAREEIRTYRRQIREATDELEAAAAKLRAVRLALSAPTVSIPGLRAMLGVEHPPEDGINGHPHY